MKHLLLLFFLLTCIANAQESNTISVISAERLNIVYRGVPNPLKIAVPGSKSFIATAPGLAKDSLGNYKLSPGPGNEIKIMIEAVMQDNSVIHEEKVFRIKGISRVNVTINSESGGNYALVMSKKNFINAEIGIEIRDFYLLEKDSDFFKVHSFEVNIDDKIYKSEGNRMSKKIIDAIKKTKLHTIIIIDNVNYGVWSPEATPKRAHPVVIQIE